MFLTILVLLLILGGLIFVHEFGHFLFAKLFKVHIHEFSVGIGPKILNTKLFNTPFLLRLFPIGGYVSLTGETEDEGPGSFVRLSMIKQTLIIFGGIVFNLLLAYVLLFFFLWKQPVITLPANIGVPYWANIKQQQSLLLIEQVQSDSSLKKYLKDEELPVLLIAIDGNPVRNFNELKNILAHSDSDVSITVCKNLDLNKTLDEYACTHKYDYKVQLREGHKLGVLVSELTPSIWDYSNYSIWIRPIGISIDILKISTEVLADMVTNAIKTHDTRPLAYSIGGPVSIIPLIDNILQSKSSVIGQLIFLTAMFSLNLAVINAIPFPGLDGWHFMLVIIRRWLRNKLITKMLTYITIAGLLFLALFAIIITIKDFNLLIQFYAK